MEARGHRFESCQGDQYVESADAQQLTLREGESNMATTHPFFGFDQQQIKTLERLLYSGDSGLSALAAAIADLSARVEALETP